MIQKEGWVCFYFGYMDFVEKVRRESHAKGHPQRDYWKILFKTPFSHQVFLCWKIYFCTGEIWGSWGSEKALMKGPMYKQQAPQLPGKNVPGKMCHKSRGSCWHVGADVIYTTMLISGPAASCWLRLSPVALHSEEPKYHSIWRIWSGKKSLPFPSGSKYYPPSE